MQIFKNVDVNFDGKIVKADIETYTRGETKSDTLYIVIIKAKRYVPFACKKYKIYFTLNFLFRLIYEPQIKLLLESYKNPFLDGIKKDEY